MIKLLLPATAALLMSVGAAQAKKATDESGRATQPPAAEMTALPPDPVAVQKWFGDAVGDILNDAGRVIDDRPEPKR